MKNIVLTLFLGLALPAFAQHHNPSSTSISITGAVKTEKTISLDDLKGYTAEKIENTVIKNHMGKAKRTASAMHGIPLKKLMEDVEINAESPKVLSEFYLVFEASDGYKVTFSWNEIFNSATGDNIFIVTQKEGKALKDISGGILLITRTDFNTGRRYVKGLQMITIKRAT